MRAIVTLAMFFFFAGTCFGQQDSTKLMSPTGQYSVGTIIYEWTDESRVLHYSSHIGDKRTIIAQIWYPSNPDTNAQTAAYSALSNDYRHVVSNSKLMAPLSDETEQAPLVLISPGRGTERYGYTTIAEELASHGLIVASVDMPEIGYTIYKDGLIVKPSRRYRPPKGLMAGPYEAVDAFFEEPTRIGTADLEFALKQITNLNGHDPNERFTNKFDLSGIGIFGHSLGGRIAGEFTARNKQVTAYMSMEGIPPRDVRLNGAIKIPIAMLCSSGTLPYAIENYNALIQARSNSVFMIELLDFGHNSVTDFPYVTPSAFSYDIEATEGLKVTRRLVYGFFAERLLDEERAFEDAMNSAGHLKYVEHK